MQQAKVEVFSCCSHRKIGATKNPKAPIRQIPPRMKHITERADAKFGNLAFSDFNAITTQPKKIIVCIMGCHLSFDIDLVLL